jgi:aspartyl-tRNA(Asn)/glutamyl-tRNA(Gln) amidotransferase subunit B
MDLEVIIGLEVHVQQTTAKSKMFCSCSNDGDTQPPNTTVCPICMGHPGTLPVANRDAIKMATKAALALNCEIPHISKFDRKHYFYPDLPKAYQISQLDQPIGQHGIVEFLDHETKEVVKVHVNRLHLEEDAAKNTHTKDGTLVDYNRGGTPLMEIVSEPDIASPAHAKAYMQELRLIMRYIGVSDADMEKGHLRCDANISLRPKGDKKLYPKTEIKNINSFSNVQKAIEYEIKRQTQLWEEGNPPQQETTRGFNADKGITEEQRSKEGAQDYRYFPEPDLPPIHFDHETPTSCKDVSDHEYNVACIKAELPELPMDKRRRFMGEYGVQIDDIITLVGRKDLAYFVDYVISELESWSKDVVSVDWDSQKNDLVQQAVNWLVNKLTKILDDRSLTLDQTRLTGENFAELMLLIVANKVNSSNALKILEIMVDSGGDASQIMIDHDLGQMEDDGALEGIVDQVLAENEKAVNDYKGGNENAIKSLIGKVMGATKGKADPVAVTEMIKQKLH